MAMIDQIRKLVSEHTGIETDVASLAEDADLYRAGMSSFASVQLMIGLEEAFDIEFPDTLLNPKTFSSLAAIQAALDTIRSQAAR
jgi:acyl carrier protein